MGHEHTAAAVANQAQGIQSIPNNIQNQNDEKKNSDFDIIISNRITILTITIIL